MRRLLAIAATLLATGLLIALPAVGADEGPYKVRAIFDNGGFIVEGEEVRIAGATVGTVESVDVSREDELVSREAGAGCEPRQVDDLEGFACPGKAVAVMNITEDGFKNFLEDASCLIRPQSLIGEKLIDCRPTQPGSGEQDELPKLPDGERGEGQRLLPLENNGKAVDLDLVQNTQRAPFRDRFRIILNDLGAGLAARGEDLGEVIDRANPALRQTNRVLRILAQQNRDLAALAANGDAVLEPLARNRTSVTGFMRNAAIAGEATAERGDELEAGLERFPETLREVRLTMSELREFADQGTPLFDDLGVAAPHFSKATQKLGPLARAGIPAFDTLGDAAEEAGPKLVAADPVLRQLKGLTDQAAPASQNLRDLLDTFSRTRGIQYLLDFIYFTVGNINGFDAFGHFSRANLQVTNCIDTEEVVVQGCEAFFRSLGGAASTAAVSSRSAESQGPTARAPAPDTTTPAPTLEELIPELEPTIPDEEPEDESGEGESGEGESGEGESGEGESGEGEPRGREETTAPQATSTEAAQLQAVGLALPTSEVGEGQLSMDEASMLLQFLLGSGS